MSHSGRRLKSLLERGARDLERFETIAPGQPAMVRILLGT
jgi:hypothetical protein